MTRFVGTPLRGTEFANAGDEAISTRVTTDPYPRVRIDAGGRITWASGSATGDTTLYRGDTDLLKTDDVFQALSGVVTLTTNGAPTQALPNGAIAVDTTNHVFYFRSNGAWQIVSGGGATLTVSDTSPADPEEGDLWFSSLTLDTFVYYSAAWLQINDAGEWPTELYELADVLITSPVPGDILVYNGTEWVDSSASQLGGRSVRYSPTFSATGLTFTGSGVTYPTYNSYYARIGDIVTFNIEINMSTITNFGTGQFKVELPFMPIGNSVNHFTAWAWVDPTQPADELNGHVSLVADHLYGTKVLDLHWTKAALPVPRPVIESILTQGSPVTFTTASMMNVNGTYVAGD